MSTSHEAAQSEVASESGDAADSVRSSSLSPSEPIRYRVEYKSLSDGRFVASRSQDAGFDESAADESVVMEYVDVRLTQDSIGMGPDPPDPHMHSKGWSYITIFSKGVNEALRCIVDYFPAVNFSGDTIQIYEPFEIFVFFEEELNAYRQRVASNAESEPSSSCGNRHAFEHIGIVQDFVRQKVQKDVEKERERHSRGYATFDMLWLLFRPGFDIYYDPYGNLEHDPYVVKSVTCSMSNSTISRYEIAVWNYDANDDWVGPCEVTEKVERFAGEKEITSLRLFPCRYLPFHEDIEDQDVDKIKEYFIDRGRKWYAMRRTQQCYQFDGFTTTFPRRKYTSLAMVDLANFYAYKDGKPLSRDVDILDHVRHSATPLKICSCDRCEDLIYRHAVPPKFSGYACVSPLAVESLTEHQYFLCDHCVEAFLFKHRIWAYLHVSGFSEATFDQGLFKHLVLKDSIKDMIKNLATLYIKDSTKPALKDGKPSLSVTQVHKSNKTPEKEKTWSADFVQGKGEGLIILLHGKPGVGKTYTAECIADYTERPLLPLTCSDIGVKPEEVEYNLKKWFRLAEDWGAIALIDEADIYMEQRQAQDLERNHLVAGFLRALEYFKGIVFLTTNRVGTFDEAFISRIHVPIFYDEFNDQERIKVWETFFEKLEEDRETTMHILQATKDYVESSPELQALKWNGREIRNAFQVAVALAQTQGNKDKDGRIRIKPDHIKSTVNMSTDFKAYLKQTHKLDPGKKAAAMGVRYDAFGVEDKGQKGKPEREIY